MNKIILISFLTVSLVAAQTKRVLFIGNSYTGVNDLPSLTQQVVASTGNTINIDSNTPGGYTLQGHSTNTTTLQKIQQGNWDFVVLQEQSQIPSFPNSYVTTNCYPFASSLNATILQHNSCAETVFYMTWGRQDGDASNCTTNPPVCTYLGMDDLLRARYTEMANTNNAILSPVGAVWRYLRTNFPSINLYSGDGSHPSVAGSYAAACTFNTTLFRNNPELITFNSTLSITDATIIKNAVKTVVFDNLATWNIGNFDTTSSFTNTLIGNLQYQFTNTSTNAISYLWDFGDGTTSTNVNPTHTYATNGNYTVALTATKCGISQQNSMAINTLGITEFVKSDFEIYPNPVVNVLKIKTQNENYSIKIYNSISQLVFEGDNTNEVQMSKFDIGIYFVHVTSDNQTEAYKIFKK